jgi:CHAT domain-containing protein
VTLSACVTGAGDEVEGEGIAGVRRAFLGAGAETVISTIWDVPVDSTRELFTQFYEGIKAGRSRIDALDAAKAAIATAYPGEPYRHCGFQLYGGTGPMEYFVNPDRLIVSWRRGRLDEPTDEPTKTRDYHAFVERLSQLGIDFEASGLDRIEAFRRVFLDGVWSIASLKKLIAHDEITLEVRQRFAEELRRIHMILGCDQGSAALLN